MIRANLRLDHMALGGGCDSLLIFFLIIQKCLAGFTISQPVCVRTCDSTGPL